MILMGLQDLLDTCEPRDPANKAAAGYSPSLSSPPTIHDNDFLILYRSFIVSYFS